MLAAILALAVVAVVPALAQVSNELGQESESADSETNVSVANEGDYATQCTPALQFGNTGNMNNAPSFVQYQGVTDDFEPGGLSVSFGGGQSTNCAGTVQQSSAASS